MLLIIKGNTKYITWLQKHLEKEHPKVRGKTRLRRGR